MGNVIAIGLTPSRTGIVIGPSRTGIVIGPSRTGIVIGPSRTGIVIGPLLNAQLRHMSVRAVWRHKLSYILLITVKRKEQSNTCRCTWLIAHVWCSLGAIHTECAFVLMRAVE